MTDAQSYAAFDAHSPLQPFPIQRREPREGDVSIEILYCGVCHSDLHQVRDEWANGSYPMVPGHEIVGRVTGVGASVRTFRPGDIAGVGCMVGSCGNCGACQRGLEQYCEGPAVFTYNSPEGDGQSRTYGGYSTSIVVDQRFVLRIPPFDALEAVAPLLCAGITTYSPLRHWKVGAGHRLAVLGVGGLGHMAVKLARALGAEVTMLSSSPHKRIDAERLGAHQFALTTDDAQLEALRGRFDFLIDTVSAPHDIADMADLLRMDGTMILLGVPDRPAILPASSLINRRRNVTGSLIGGVAETQEMLDFCFQHRIVADVEVIPIQSIERAYERMLRGDVKYRFVIDARSFR